MFDLDAVSFSTHERSGAGHLARRGGRDGRPGAGRLRRLSGRAGASRVAYAVGGYIAAAYWFTSSTSFANPAVTVARMLSDTFAGIAPASVPMFVLMQLVGGVDRPRPACACCSPRPPRRSSMPDRTSRPCCSSACTTPAARRWRPATSGTWPASGSTYSPPARSRPTGSTRSPSRRWPRRASTSPPSSRRCSPPDAVHVADVVVTMGCGDECPFFPGKRYEDWVLDDPAGRDIDAVRPIRDEIRRRVEKLVADLV